MENITKRDIWMLHNVLENLKRFGSQKFKYNVLRNIKLISAQIEPLKEVEEPINEIIKPFIDVKNELIKKYGTADELGNISIKETDIESMSKFKEEIKTETENFKDIIEEYKNNLEDFNVLLNEDVDFEVPTFYKLQIENLPEKIEFVIIELLDKLEIIEE